VRSVGLLHQLLARPAKPFLILINMNQSIQITIDGQNLDKHHDGDWTITIMRNGTLAAQSGLSGTAGDALQAARDAATEAGINMGEEDE